MGPLNRRGGYQTEFRFELKRLPVAREWSNCAMESSRIVRRFEFIKFIILLSVQPLEKHPSKSKLLTHRIEVKKFHSNIATIL